MHFLRLPNGLWFLTAGGGSEIQKDVALACPITCSTTPQVDLIGSSVSLNLSATYLITTSCFPISSTDVEFSAFTYRATVSASRSVMVAIDVDDGAFSSLELGCTITPVYVLEQTGQIDIAASLNLMASISAQPATISPFITVNAVYNISISASVAVLGSDNPEVSLALQATASTNIQLQIQTGVITHNLNATYGVSCSVGTTLVIPAGGGLVWSRKKQRYVAVRVGNAS